MPASHFLVLLIGVVLFHEITHVSSYGYHYDQPTRGGHYFSQVSTISPLPPVPALPPLPTARTHTGGGISTGPYRNIVQSSSGPSGPSAPSAPSGPSGPSAPAAPRQYGQRVPLQVPVQIPVQIPVRVQPNPPQPQNIRHPQQYPYGAQQQPPSAPFYDLNAVKQYEVVELIDNDIELSREPFLMKPYFDHIRSRAQEFGLAGLPAPPAIQLNPQANRFTAQTLSTQTPADPILLGSGGLGFIRLPNGNVFLGSGSLGYISSQQRSQLVQDIRSRPGDTSPDAIHFGHGPFTPLTRLVRYK